MEMEISIDLNDRFMMAIRGFFTENQHLINENNIKLINRDDDYLQYYLETIFETMDNNIDINFGKYAVSNGYINENDEEEITILIRYMSGDNERLLNNLINKINLFSGPYSNENMNIIQDIINDIYDTRDIRLDLK